MAYQRAAAILCMKLKYSVEEIKKKVPRETHKCRIGGKKSRKNIPRKTHKCKISGRNQEEISHGKCTYAKSVGKIMKKSPTGNAQMPNQWEKFDMGL
jgi:hypothetical protein